MIFQVSGDRDWFILTSWLFLLCWHPPPGCPHSQLTAGCRKGRIIMLESGDKAPQEKQILPSVNAVTHAELLLPALQSAGFSSVFQKLLQSTATRPDLDQRFCSSVWVLREQGTWGGEQRNLSWRGETSRAADQVKNPNSFTIRVLLTDGNTSPEV